MPNVIEPKVLFLSYASEDHEWVKQFTDPKWFDVAPIQKRDYLAGDKLEYGELGPWIDERLDEAHAVIAFISEKYRQKTAPLAELQRALEKYQRDRLIFVPIMLDSKAKSWWAKRRKEGGLKELPDDFVYSDFTDGNGSIDIAADSEAQSRIARISKRIKDTLIDPSPSDRSEAAEPMPTPTVVVLGHPTNRPSQDIAAQSIELARAAQAEDLLVRSWKDGWLIKTAAREELGLSQPSDAVFVQPLAPGEAAEHAEDVGKTAKRLSQAGVNSAPVVLWLPSGQSDLAFEQLAKDATEPWPTLPDLRLTPALRVGSPGDLATGLRAMLRPSLSPDNPVVQIETVGSPEGSRPDLEATLLAERLRQLFGDIVKEVVTPEASSPWQFWGTQFPKQIALIRGSRAIVAVHDLHVTPSANDRVKQQSIELKFQQMQDYVGEAGKAGKLKVFWAALLCKTASALPFARYPHNARYKDWRLLGFERVDPSRGAASPVRPDPASLGVFRNELFAWAS